ncbi:MAG: hypothetical protein Q9213_003510 [Squamulea squamosa]
MLGQQEYKRKNYHAALNFFNSVISQEKQPGITVLDCRAATSEKLGDLHAALKDGRRMISDYKSECEGYLRTGKILQLLDKDSVALGIYKYGLRNVSPSASKYQLLRELYESMNQKRRPREAKDPLTVLPTEVVQMIMSYLDFKHLVNWRDYLKSTPSLWATLDFSKAKANVPKTALQRYVRFSQGRVTKVVMSRFTTQQPTNVQYMVSSCKGIEHLEVDSGYANTSLIKAGQIAKNLKCLVLSASCPTSLDCVSQILGKCTTLVRAEFHRITHTGSFVPQWQGDMSRLRTLVLSVADIDLNRPEFMPSLDPLINMIPDIRELRLKNWISRIGLPKADGLNMKYLETLDLVNFRGEVNPEALPSLRNLVIHDCDRTLKRFMEEPMSDLRIDSLTELHLAIAHTLNLNSLLRLLGPKPPNLKKLRLSHCLAITTADLVTLIEMGVIDQLTELDLSGTRSVTDVIIQSMASRAHQLKKIRLSMTDITGVGVKALLRNPHSQLQYLGISYCWNVSADAVILARNIKGLTVESHHQEPKGRRKIRWE